MTQSHHREPLNLRNAEVWIALSNHLERTVSMAKQLRRQAEIRSERVESKSRGNQLLIGCWNTGNRPVVVSQESTTGIGKRWRRRKQPLLGVGRSLRQGDRGRQHRFERWSEVHGSTTPLTVAFTR